MLATMRIVVLIAVAIVVTACVAWLPQKLTLGTSVDERFRQSGYSASLSWDLRPKRVSEEYVTLADGEPGGDLP